MAKLTLLFLSLAVWLTWAEGRSFPSRRFPINRGISHARGVPGKVPRTSSLSSNSDHMLSERNNLFARVAGLSELFGAFSNKVAKRDDDEQQQQQQQVVSPSQSPCEQIKAKLSTAIDIFYYLKDDWIADTMTLLESPIDLSILPPKEVLKQYLVIVCPILNARTIDELIEMVPPGPLPPAYVIRGKLDNFKLFKQAGYIDGMVQGFRGLIDAIEALVYELRDHGVTAPAPGKPIIPTLKNYFTASELQQIVGDVIDAYWDDVLPLTSMILADVGRSGNSITAEVVKQHLNPYLTALLDAKSLEDVETAVGINPRYDPRGAQRIDNIVRVLATAPDEIFDFDRIMIDVIELILDNMVLLQ